MVEIMDYYDSVAGTVLAGEFYKEFRRSVKVIKARPVSFALVGNDLRRCNFDRFPHHILFEVTSDFITILAVKHDHRDPQYGVERKRESI